jgi:hypothetical protein
VQLAESGPKQWIRRAAGLIGSIGEWMWLFVVCGSPLSIELTDWGVVYLGVLITSFFLLCVAGAPGRAHGNDLPAPLPNNNAAIHASTQHLLTPVQQLSPSESFSCICRLLGSLVYSSSYQFIARCRVLLHLSHRYSERRMASA